MRLGIHHYTPESKQQSKQLKEAGCSAPKEKRLVPSAGKVVASVFWNAEGILFIDYLEKGETITREYYCNLLTILDEKINEKKPLKMDLTEGSKTSANINQTPGNHPKVDTLNTENGESIKSRKGLVCKKKKKSSFITTVHLPTKVFWQWEN
jgi:hypothetical protein